MFHSKAIGIDLGTSDSCVGVWVNDRVEIIPDGEGNRTTPSYVSFNESGRLIGVAAKKRAAMNPYNTIFSVNRIIGRKFDDPAVQTAREYLPFKIINKKNRPFIQAEYRGEQREFSPEEISAMILVEMKEAAESYLGTTVKDAVIATPAHFDYSQRQAIRDAGTIAGLNVLYLINKLSATSITYCLRNEAIGERNVLFFYLGAGSLDVTLATIEEGICEVKATSGNAYLGGEDFDNRLIDHFVQDFKHKKNKDISTNARAVCRLRTACEQAKRTLSFAAHAFIEIDSLLEDIDFHSTITRTDFENLCQDLFLFALEPIKRVIQDSKISKSDVHEIVLIGGSTRIPFIVKLISEFFDGKKTKRIDPDEAVVNGAAVQAAILSGNTSEKTQDLLLLEVASLSLGIQTHGGVMTPLIKCNTTIPTKKSEIVPIRSDNESRVVIHIYEGNHPQAADNNLLGKLELPRLPSPPRSVLTIEVTFDIDGNGILSVSASDKTTGQSNRITVTNDDSRLSREEIRRMVAEAEKYKADDEAAASRNLARNNLEMYACSLREFVNDVELTDDFEAIDKAILEFAIDETLSWLDSSPASEEDYGKRQKKLEGIVNAIM